MNNLEETGPHIWLRYSIQYDGKDGRKRTFEMGIPVPIGASAEVREQLMREAESGMSQLVEHVEARVSQNQSRPPHTPSQGSQVAQSASQQNVSPATPAPRTAPIPAQRPANRPVTSAPPGSPLPQASQPPPQNVPAPAPAPARKPEQVDMPPTRQTIGASMPMNIGPTLDSSGNLSIPEFIKYIQQNMNMRPPEAMKMLNVKSLQGLNLRDAAERLRHLAAPDSNPGASQESQENDFASYNPPAPDLTPGSRSAPLTGDVARSRHAEYADHDAEASEDTHAAVEMRVPRPSVGFDEEVGPDEGEDSPMDGLEDLEDLEDSAPAGSFTPQQLERATTKLSELRESQGAAVASVKRLQVLHNVTESQIEDEQLQAVIEGVWNINALKKLKVDQVEALISWAKEDYFVEEVEAMLSIVEEEHYARGNR